MISQEYSNDRYCQVARLTGSCHEQIQESVPRYRFPPEIISHAVWLYHRFTLSFRDIAYLLAIRGIQTCYESVRRWCLKFPQQYGKTPRKRQGQLGNIWYLDEVFLSIGGKRQYLWRAIDQDGDVIDILVQSHGNKDATPRFFKKLFIGQASTPLRVVTDKLRSYQAALREVAPSLPHITDQYENNQEKYHINQAGSRKGKCADLNHPGRRNDFSPFTDS